METKEKIDSNWQDQPDMLIGATEQGELAVQVLGEASTMWILPGGPDVKMFKISTVRKLLKEAYEQGFKDATGQRAS